MDTKFFLVFLFLVFVFSNCSAGLDTAPQATPLELAQAEQLQAEVAIEAAKAKAKAEKAEAEEALVELGQAEVAIEAAKAKVAAEAKKEKEALAKGLASLELPSTAPLFLDLKFNSFTSAEAITPTPAGWELQFDYDNTQFILLVEGKEVIRFSEPEGAKYPEYWRLCPGCVQQVQFAPKPKG